MRARFTDQQVVQADAVAMAQRSPTLARTALDDVGAGRLTPEDGQTKRAEPFALVELAAEIEALRFANSHGRRRSAPSVADPPVRPH